MREMRGEVGKETPKKEMENMTSKVVQIGHRPVNTILRKTVILENAEL